MEFTRPLIFDERPLLAYLASAVMVAIATALTALLWLVVDRPASAPIFIAAIVLSAMIGGFRVGVFAAMMGGLALDYFFIQPFYQLTLASDDVLRWVFFVTEGTVVSWITEKLSLASAELNSSREELRELTRHQQTLREEEQKRIAREIHDELGQMLTGLKLDIHLMKKKVGAGMPTDLDDLSSQVDATISSVRRIASELRPSILDDFGLIPALEWQAGEFESKFGIDCAFVCTDESVQLDPEAEAAVFRIVQEALTNIARHARASSVCVTVENADGDLRVAIEDDGVGIDLEKVKKGRSLGIVGMRERARLIGATLELGTGDGSGTVVELAVPISAPAAQRAVL